MDSASDIEKKHDKEHVEYADTPIEALSSDGEEYARREKKLVRKLDTFIAPVMMLLMLISYLDRGNIGFAATQGMTRDINLKPQELNIAVSVFYIFYILAEFPSSIFVKRLQFNRVIPFITLSWGLVCLCTGFVQNFAGLLVTRILLGFFEGCLFPAMTLFLANWYMRHELSVRISFLFIASALSGAFGGLIAYGVLRMDGVAGFPGWRWLYILEGILTVLFAVVCVKVVPKDYQTAYFLNAEDRALMKRRAELAEAYSGGSGHYTKQDIKLAAKDIKSWAHGLIQICVVTILYGFGTFLPIIIREGFGYSVVQAQYLVIPVNIWGAIVYAIGAVIQDKYGARFISLVTIAPFGMLGYALLLAPIPTAVKYFATYLVATACFLCTGSNIAWLSGNCAPDGKRAGSVGILLTLTNIGGVVSGQIYYSKAAPNYFLGHGWSLGCLVFAWCGWWGVKAIYLKREAWKDKMIAEGYDESQEVYTDRSPSYRYQL